MLMVYIYHLLIILQILKRRTTTETWTKDTPTLFEDGHAWRKYGQKVILNAKHPRYQHICLLKLH